MHSIDWEKAALDLNDIDSLNAMWQRCAANIIYMTTTARSGHPGGSLSLLHILLLLYSMAHYDPKDPHLPDRDRIFISNGHIAPGVYAVLAEAGFFNIDEAICGFRKAGSLFGGHIESTVPGVEWSTGNLGQGMSVACGAAMAGVLKKNDFWIYVIMGDGENQKGQISEARRFAVKNKLNRLVGIVDLNGLQIGGQTAKIMPQNIAGEYESAGWNTIYVDDGNDFQQIFAALKLVHEGRVQQPEMPSVLIAHTVMGHGISFMENDEHFHGTAATDGQAQQALAEIGVADQLDYYHKLRAEKHNTRVKEVDWDHTLAIDPGYPITYPVGTLLDNRSAYGAALKDLGQRNNHDFQHTPILGLTCDLEGSVKMSAFKKACPDQFIESGIQEHHTAAMAGRLSVEGFQPFFSTFGVFGVAETYNQQRLNAFNRTNLKLVCTHCGLDVGQDGPTHQGLDYIGLLQNAFGFKVFLPADPNQTDRIIRYIATHWGNYFVGMGRSKMSIITTEEGKVVYDDNYCFSEGKSDWLRDGDDGAIFAMGPMVPVALEAAAILKKQGQEIAVINMASIIPLDRGAVIVAAATGRIVTIEDHSVYSGLGSLVASVLAEERLGVSLTKLGVSGFASSGDPRELYRQQGLTVETLVAQF